VKLYTQLYIKISVLFIFLLISYNSQSQTNCNNAVQVNIPFNTINGNTCLSGNNYNGLNGCEQITSWINPYGGNDYWFKFTPNVSGLLNINVFNIVNGTSSALYPRMIIFKDCPLINGECILSQSVTTIGNNPYFLNVVKDVDYYIILSSATYTFINASHCFSFSINGSMINTPLNNDCWNINGTNGNFNGWLVTRGRVTPSLPGSPIPLYNITGIGVTPDRHVITTGTGVDNCSPIPIVRPTRTNSIRLGDLLTGSQGESLSYKYLVSESNANLTYWYAVVFEDAGHLPHEQPFFRSLVRNQNDEIIPCSEFVVSANVNLPGFLASNCFGYQYKNWSSVNINLAPYIGEYVTLEFTVGDCVHSGHRGYAYLDVECQPIIIPLTPLEICEGDNITLVAPSGYLSYNWQPLNLNTQSITISPNINDVITLNVTNFNGCINSYQYTFESLPCCFDTTPILHSNN
jgi:hypothetical protein